MSANGNYIAPQSASAPITTNLRKDELAALMTADQGATAQQRIAATGNSVPLVFTKQVGNIGGAWVTPPAARYGAQENPNLGDYFAFGLVVSDGKIAPIAAADVWKGPVKVNTLSGYKIQNAYGSMPTAGFDYTLTSVGVDTPASSETKVERFEIRQASVNNAFSGNSYELTVNNVTWWGAALSIRNGPNGNFSGIRAAAFEIYVNGVLTDGTYKSSDPNVEIGAWNARYSFPDPVTFKIRAFTRKTSWAGTSYAFFEPYYYNTEVRTTITTPAVPGAVSSLPLYPGAGGSFAGMSTLATAGRYATDAENGIYKQQVRCFVRSGVEVDRVNGGAGSSNSFPDLAFYLLKNAGKAPAQMIDLSTFQSADLFNQKYQLLFNGVLANSVNLKSYLTRVAPLFLLRFVQINGKHALRPALPITATYDLDLSPVVPSHHFDLNNIVAGTYSKSYVEVTQRKPFCALMTWRSQTESLYGTPKTTEVRYAGTAIDGPFEQYDMEEFCATEAHATLVGKYIIASRKLVTHTVEFQTTELLGNLAPADIVSVAWSYETSLGAGQSTTDLYQVDSVTEGANGVFSVTATHFPVTASGASQVAVDMLSTI